jgi:RNA polymerase sigma-70 factor (ECF subfamily)
MTRPPDNINTLVDHLFRHESGKMVSVLSRLLGLQNMETAHDIVQDTLLQAMNTWSYNGIPENPPAWLYRVAKNKAIDFLRRQEKFKEISPQYSYLLQSEYTLASTLNNLFLDDEIQDSQLRMIFACSHPSITEESQIALTLKALCGLNANEIARAFLTNEETINKRIYRAREKIKAERIELNVPQGKELPVRLDVVLKCLYLLFNEGYNSSDPENLIREDLCWEAMRLVYVLTTCNVTNLPRTNALLSLMCFQASRLQARLDDKGNIVLLKHQDRRKWYKPLIESGFLYLEIATENSEPSAYHVEATIASIHASASSFEQTDWETIYHLYETLYRLQPAPIVALHKAIASAYATSREFALEQLLQIKGLEDYYLYHTSIGEIYFELQNKKMAKKFYKTALHLTNSKQEQQLLQIKISNCETVQ